MQHANPIVDLFDKVGFIDTYRRDSEDFYQTYFESTLKMHKFFMCVFTEDERLKHIPRRMMNRVRYLVSLALNIENISTTSDALRVVFFQCCIEALHNLSCKSEVLQNRFFLDNCNKEDSQYIINHFDIFDVASYLETETNGTTSEYCYKNTSLVLFAEILRETRNIVLHEGDFWSIQIFNSKDDCGLVSSIQTKKKNIKDELKNSYLQYYDEESRIYFEQNNSLIKLLNSSDKLLCSFSTTLDLQKFTSIFVRACINFIIDYIASN